VTRWRVVICLIVILVVVVIGLSGLFPEQPTFSGPRFLRGSDQPDLRGGIPLPDLAVRPAIRMLGHIGTLLAQFVLGMVLVYLLPRHIQYMAKAVSMGWTKLLRDLALGLAIVILLAAVGLLSALSLRTFPLPFIVLGLLFIVASAGMVGIALAVGRGLLERAGWYRQRPLLALALGTVIISTFGLIPVFGDIVLALVLLTGAGVAVATHFGTGSPWTLNSLVEDVAP
jgi:hypothetical protein